MGKKFKAGGRTDVLRLLALVAAIFGLAFLIQRTSLKFDNVELITPEGQTHMVELPYWHRSFGRGNFVFRGTIDYSWASPRVVKVLVDDCIQSLVINGKPVPLNATKTNGLCGWERGFQLDLGSVLAPGRNQVEITVKDAGGAILLFLNNTFADSHYSLLMASLIFFSLLAVYNLLRKIKMPQTVVLLLLGGLLLRIVYLTYTPWNVRQYDVGGHVEYIAYILDHWRLPRADTCWECYQPPLYYLTSAVYLKVMSLFGFGDIYSGLQVLSLVYSFGFMLFGSLFFLRFFRRRRAAEMASALLIFWPAAILHSARISNEGLFYLFYSISFYYLWRWREDRESRGQFLYVAVVAALLSLFTRMNGLVLFAVLVGSALTLSLWFPRERLKMAIKQLGVVALVGFLGALIVFRIAPWYQGFVATTKVLHGGLRVGNRAFNYLWFDEKIFLSKAFTTPWADWGGRQYYWNYLFKTSLFGEWMYKGVAAETTALVMSYMFLGILAYMGWGIVISSRPRMGKIVFLLLNTIGLMSASIVLRVRVPCACAGDFRYVFPILLTAIPFYILAVDNYRQRQLPLLEYGGYVLAGGFVLLSVIFFLLLPFV
jgi:hypothetical protein